MKYFTHSQITIDNFDPENISKLYSQGFKFTRIARGVMQSTRNLRVDLSKFKLSSENRRILRKNSELTMEIFDLPYVNYDYKIAKLCKDFYTQKFNDKIFSAMKVRDMFQGLLNMNAVAVYKIGSEAVGYCLLYKNSEIVHYCYPFYELKFVNSSLGIGMMTTLIEYAFQNKMKFVYLGGCNKPSDLYKLQFSGVEWWEEEKKNWSDNFQILKILVN